MFHNIHQISATIFLCVLHIPAQVLWTCEDRRCELYRPYKLWPAVSHLGSMPSQTPEHEPEERARRKKQQLRRLKHEQLMLSLQFVSSKHILASKGSRKIVYGALLASNCGWVKNKIYFSKLSFLLFLPTFISVSVTHLVLMSSEDFDLLSFFQVPQSDCEIVG